MSTKLDSRKKLSKMVDVMSESDAQQLLVFAIGMDTGKKISNHASSQAYMPEPPQRTA